MELHRPASLADLEPVGNALLLAGGTEVVPLLKTGLVRADVLVDIRGVVPRTIAGSPGGGLRIGGGATLAELEADTQVPEALREACRLAASPQLRNMGSLAGNLLQATRCWYWRLGWSCRLQQSPRGYGDECFAHEGEHREHAIIGNDFCASAHPSDPAAALLALNATLRTTARELTVRELYRLPTQDDRSTTTLRPGEVILDVDIPPADASVYLKAMERKRWSFPIVGVAAARTGDDLRVALAGVAPIPWLLADGDESGRAGLEAATPLLRNVYKLDVARALIRRAVGTITA